MKNNLITLSLTFIGGLLGLIIYLNTPSVEIWYAQYEYLESDEKKLPVFFTTDTVSIKDDVTIRNFTSSISDTLKAEGIVRHELKLFKKSTNNKTITQITEDVLPDNTKVISTSKTAVTSNKKIILYYFLFGFCLGLLGNIIFSRKKVKS